MITIASGGGVENKTDSPTSCDIGSGTAQQKKQPEITIEKKQKKTATISTCQQKLKDLSDTIYLIQDSDYLHILDSKLKKTTR